MATMSRSLQPVTVAGLSLKLIVLAPCVEPKLKPVTVTEVPARPSGGERFVTVGAVMVSVAHLIAASNNAPPLLLRLAPVVSLRNTPARRAGASRPGNVAPES